MKILSINPLLRELLEALKDNNSGLHDELVDTFEKFNKSNFETFDELIEEYVFAIKYLEPISMVKGKEFCGKVIEMLYSTPEEESNDIIFSEYLEKIKSLSDHSEIFENSYFEVLILKGFPFKKCSTLLNTSLFDFVVSGNENYGEIRCLLSITIAEEFISLPWANLLIKLSELIIQNNYIPNIERPFFNTTEECHEVIGSNKFDNFLIDIGVWISDEQNSVETTPQTYVFELIPIFESESKQILKSYKKFQKLVNSGKIQLLDLNRGK